MADGTHHWLRKDDQDSTKASFPELFFDLIFVFALIQLSETLAEDFSFGIAAEALLFIFALWWVWIHTTWVTNLLDAEIIPVRLMLFAVMFLGIILAIALPRAFTDLGFVFALAYSAIQLGRSLFALYAFRDVDAQSFRTFQRITIWMIGSCVLWIAGGFAQAELRLFIWIAALVVEYVGPMLRYRLPGLGAAPPETLDVKGEHMAERSALFVTIALGETILTTGKIASAHLESDGTPLILVSAFLSTVLMWWIYFHDGQEQASDKAEDSQAPQKTAQHLFVYGHVPIVAGIILTAVGEDFAISHPGEKGAMGHVLALLGGPMLFLAGAAWMKRIASQMLPRSHVAGVLALAACFLLAPILPNFGVQILSNMVLLLVAVWEYMALKYRRSAA